MAKFRFNLQAVLDQREREEQARRRVVAEFERERLALEDALRGRRTALDACRDDLRDALGAAPGSPTPVDLRAVRMQSAASFRVHGEAQRLALRLAGTLKRLEGARAQLLAATTARKAVELLKARRFEEWKREQARRETAATDELAVMGAARRAKEAAA